MAKLRVWCRNHHLQGPNASYVNANGRRICRACQRDRRLRYMARPEIAERDAARRAANYRADLEGKRRVSRERMAARRSGQTIEEYEARIAYNRDWRYLVLNPRKRAARAARRDSQGLPPPHATFTERIAWGCEYDGAHMIWTGHWRTEKTGVYPGRVLNDEGRSVAPHRYLWELEHGPLPKGHELTRTCDRERCIEPAHQRAGPSLNLRRRRAGN